MGILYDNTKSYKIVASKRSTGLHGWTGAQIVFWNAAAKVASVHQPPTGRNYVFCMGRPSGNGSSLKGPNNRKTNPSSPRSLYLQQLEERLGKQAIENITTEGQRKAVTDKKSDQSREKLIWDPIQETLSK